MRKQHGFTLIELLIVLAIIGIIAAIAIPVYLAAMQRSRQAQSIENMRTLATHIHRYQVEEATFPLADDVEVLNGILMSVSDREISIVDDGWHNKFIYSCATGAHYSLSSLGSDGLGTHGADGEFPFLEFDKEITIRDGEFVQKPR